MSLGLACVIVDGVNTINPVRVEALDGSRLNPASPGHFTLKIYAPNADTNTITPIYQVSDNVTQGSTKIR